MTVRILPAPAPLRKCMKGRDAGTLGSTPQDRIWHRPSHHRLVKGRGKAKGLGLSLIPSFHGNQLGVEKAVAKLFARRSPMHGTGNQYQ